MDANFLKLLNQLRKKILIRQIWYVFQLLLVFAGAFVLCLITLASVIIIPYWDKMLWIGILFIVVSGVVISFPRRVTLKESALFYDRFVEDDRVTAAYSSLRNGHVLSPLIIRDALVKMRETPPDMNMYRRRIIQPRLMISTILLVFLSLLIFTQRDATFQEAKRLEKEKEIIAQSNSRITKQANKKENASIKERLLKENEQLKEKKAATERYEEINKKVKELSLQKKTMEKQKAKLQEVKKELNGLDFPDIKEAIQETDSDKLQQKVNQLSEEQKRQLLEVMEKQGIASLEELANVLKESEGSNQLNEIANLQEEMQREADLLGKAIGKSRTTDQGQATQKTPSKQKGEAASSTQSNSRSEANKQNASSTKGSGATSSSGQNGQGAGTGSGTGKGSSGKGNGTGAGFGQGDREWLSVPEKTGGESRIELDAGKLGDGKKGDQFQANGPVQKGSLRPYEEVYQQYYSSYRSGTDRATIPKDLEHIIESYFSEIDPGE
ncbi:hypothetical protein [Rossellomorea vietnamensis]|uniref:hypothetical protein n=1 Tax=Rossellomorea vietnamensis TaxID=218284 RepID=UPI0005548D84|nr:hypothetical protein [Rossellomorea vietnamensis]